MKWTVDHIVRATGGQLLYGAKDQHFDRIGIDSRRSEAGMLFVAIRGEVHDGHDFVQQVVESGIRGIVVQADQSRSLDHDAWKRSNVACVVVTDTTRALGRMAAFQRRRWQLPVVAITGSNGKTTTRKLTASVMAQRFKTFATQGNLNNEIGVP